MSSKEAKRPNQNINFCAHGTCLNNKLGSDKGVYFIPFPTPKTCLGLESAKRWLNLCKRDDITLESIHESSLYVCSRHFVDPLGPTSTHPDPISATSTMALRDKKAPESSHRIWLLSALRCTVPTNNDLGDKRNDSLRASYAVPPQSDKSERCGRKRKVPLHRIRPVFEASTQTTNRDPPRTIAQKASDDLFEAVTKDCREWHMKSDTRSRTFTAHIVKLQDFQESLTVIVVFRNEKFDVSVFVHQFQLDSSHKFWLSNPTCANVGDIIGLIGNLSRWRICFKTKNTSRIGKTTDCMLLCDLSSLVCDVCETKRETGVNITRVRSIMNMQHKLMNEPELRGKLNILQRARDNVARQNKRLKSKLDKSSRQLKIIKKSHQWRLDSR